MTVSSTSNRVVYQGNGTTTVFPFAFKIQQAADLVVIYSDATGTEFTLSPSQYSASGFGLDAGGSVTYPLSGSPIATGTALTIYRDVAATQPTSISNQGAMWPQVIEAALDRLTFIVQKIADIASRSLTVSATDSGTLNPLPNKTQRANSYLAFDGNGQPIAAQSLSLASVSAWLAANFLPQATATAALNALGGVAASVLTTTGDLFVRGASSIGRLAVGSTGQVLTVVGGTAAWATPATPILPAGYIQGLTLANNVSNSGRDIDIAAGLATDGTGALWLVGPALTKKTDTTWAAGTNQGALDTGTVGNGGYYVWLIGRTDLSAFDYLTSLSATAPTMPAGYTYKRLVGWFKRSSGNVVACKTRETAGGGLLFMWVSPLTEINTNLGTGSTDYALNVPTAFSVKAHFALMCGGVGNLIVGSIWNPDQGGPGTYNFACDANNGWVAGSDIWMNTSATGTLRAGCNFNTSQFQISTVEFEWSRR